MSSEVVRCAACQRHHDDPGRVVCAGCIDQLVDDLGEIADRFDRLDATPGRADTGSRGAPGFRSAPPGSVHIMSMRDPRSRPDRFGTDDHTRPVLSVQATLLGLAFNIRAGRGLEGAPPRAVGELTGWIARHADWLSRDQLGAEACARAKTLRTQLRPVTGDPAPKPVGHCLEDACRAPVFAPESEPRGRDESVRAMPAVECSRCGSVYDGRRLIVLRLVEEAAAA